LPILPLEWPTDITFITELFWKQGGTDNKLPEKAACSGSRDPL